MAVRLSKIAREFNVGLSTIVEFLHSKGIKISSDPNAKLTDEDYALVAKEFSSDSQVKKESSLVDLKNTRKKKETVTIDNAGNISSGNEDTEEEEEEFISIKDEVRFENKIKIVDHIDLNPEKKTQPEPVEAKVEQPKRETQEEITEKVEEPKVTRVEVEETQEEERKVTPEVEPEISVQMEESSESTPFKVAQPALKDVKVVGTIDLDAINQRTRPPKKSKQERERDRREQKKANKPFVSAAKTEQPVASPSTDIVNKGEEDADIRKNVAFGIPEEEIDDEKLWYALREAQLDEFIKTLPDGVYTGIGERGIRLSGGQRQRIGIARALYNDPEVLILDEATSALDNDTEAAIMDSINRLHGKKTLLIIAHRLQTIEKCDMVYRVENGAIVKER